ncbi:hypothetical protein F5884DRAFT_821438 [Xylogone sp. PMI_703]|nr:hypothetical protein F5884DRAFT_821438 [Xylogone sp. PMI_703]
MESPLELEPDKPEESIIQWYDSRRPIWIDLVGDYAGKELFLIEGDSLLRHCFEDKRLDFHDGFQILHAVYLVERFLDNLVKRHCNFEIAFFEGKHRARNALITSRHDHESPIQLSRETISRHLQEVEKIAVKTNMDKDLCLHVTIILHYLLAEGDELMATALLLHTLLLRHLPLTKRSFPLITFDDSLEDRVNDCLSAFSIIARFVANEYEGSTVDLMDGRLFRATIKGLCDGSILDPLSTVLGRDWQTLYRIIQEVGGTTLSLTSWAHPGVSKISTGLSDSIFEPRKRSILPFSNRVFDAHLKDINITSDSLVQYESQQAKRYREITHWHNHRKPLQPKSATKVQCTKWYNPLRLNQFYMREMLGYASSLTGATGKGLVAETITVGPKQMRKLIEDTSSNTNSALSTRHNSKSQSPESSRAGSNAKKGTKKASSSMSAAEKIRVNNLARIGKTKSDKALESWTNVRETLDQIESDEERYRKTAAYLKDLDSTKLARLEVEVNLHMLQTLLGWWASFCKSDKKAQGYEVVALIWANIRSICTSKSTMTVEVYQHVTKVCSLIGISDALTGIPIATTEEKVTFDFRYPAQPGLLNIEMSQIEFQLNFCGPYMDRMLDAKPDPRVSGFIPDGWQRDVLDQLDANKSVFVVAPTSAGKTFISFYAMEQVLRRDDDGVLVYVAPTKALVNQIAAEIQGRFSKQFRHGGKSVWAIHSRDYRVNEPLTCQILVTVPHILQIMLLSPSNAHTWATRVRRIIFDEIHSIGQSDDGTVWEQLLLMAPCPIIALSATVGNPEQFSAWLTDTQRSTGTELKMIQHANRYSDLRKYIFHAPEGFEFEVLGTSHGVGLGLDGAPGMEYFHPVSSLVEKIRGMPDDLALEPRDCLSLWKVMSSYQTEKYKVPQELDPNKALPPCIRKADIFRWEKELKKVLLEWMTNHDSPFDKVVSKLALQEKEVEQFSSATSPFKISFSVKPSDIRTTTLPLLYQLHQRGALPAILFNYDRGMCEEVGRYVFKRLLKAENEWKKGPEWKKLMEGYAKYLQRKNAKPPKEAKQSKKSHTRDDDEYGSKPDRMRYESSDGDSPFAGFDPNDPQQPFSFADVKKLQKSEFDEYVWQLKRQDIRPELIAMLQRGIGIHHAGMNRKYRQCVEMLFRRGYLRVVIATGTLSLGINMPCSTVVFSGDSVYLTALNFRQASGRAGRRGFDLLGNVVFQNMSRERAGRLLSSRLPDLTGHFPITTTLVLRLFTLLKDSKESEYAVKIINSLLSQPRLYLGGESFREQVLHHLRFSIEYLRRNDLLGLHGEPVNFTSCVSHLYFTENSSFAFHALLRGGYFNKLCADIHTKSSMVLREMMLVLAHLFGRRLCREVDDPDEQENIKRSPSIVYLPALPDAALSILRQHNKETLDIFTTYAETFASQHITEDEQHLPFTRTLVGPAGAANRADDASNSGNNLPGIDFLPALPVPKVRSIFFALSGHGDEMETIEDLCSSSREGVFLESSVIPHLEIYPDEMKSPLNAYLYDFFMHGDENALVHANGVRKSDVWFALNDFSLVLATIVTSLAVHLGFGGDDDPDMLNVVGSGDAIQKEVDEKAAGAASSEGDDANSTSSVSTTNKTPTKGVVVKQETVADNWDESKDGEGSEEDSSSKSSLENDILAKEIHDTDYRELLNVYKAFRMLQTEFNEKFKAIWA